jgi:hypothetical protein
MALRGITILLLCDEASVPLRERHLHVRAGQRDRW